MSASHPFYTEVEWLYSKSISNGWQQPDDTRIYKPGDAIARDAMAAFLYRFSGVEQPQL